MKKICLSLLFALTVFCATSSFAQTSIMQGWSSKFPYYITSPGSYILTSNIVAPAGVNAFVVTSSNVTLNLNGYSISGQLACTQNGCNSNTYSVGISVTSEGSIIVKNGSINGFYNCFYNSYGPSTIEYLNVSSCNTGIIASSGTIDHNAVTACADNGIDGSLATISDNSVSGVGNDGISATNATVTNNTVNYALYAGIQSFDSSVVNNTLNSNSYAGLYIIGGAYANNTMINNTTDVIIYNNAVSSKTNACTAGAC